MTCSLPTSSFSQRVGAETNSFKQSVGVVLSGGGATGLAHVGVLMALEEAEIPIDYIAGTSAGALVGSMYACGFSPKEIQTYILSDKFLKMSSGKLESEDHFLLRKKDDNASMLDVPFSKDSIFQSFLPTNFITPSLLDYEMFNFLGITGAAVNDDFDSLFVPFRCVASDVTKKESVVFRKGKLNAAVRASMTYPFYVNPIRIDGTLLFDGGLYNNFPANVLYECFDNDYIIGSNVSFNAPPPDENNLISQVTNMLMRKTNFQLPCENGIIISPELDVSTFDFSDAEIAINKGYESAQSYIDSIRMYVHERKSVEEVNKQRKAFKNSISELAITDIKVNQGDNMPFVKSTFIEDSITNPIDEKTFSKRFFRAYSSPQIKYIYPTLEKNSDSTHQLNLDVTKEKPFELRVGGHFSSRPVNTGYIGLSYYDIGTGAVGIHGESYFGKFYGSTKIHINYDLPTLYPFRATPYFVLNRWDYFRSLSTFFEDVKPSFLIQNEMYYGMKLSIPASNTSKLALDIREFKNNDEYYQTLTFENSDTADITNFNGQSAILQFEHNTLNKKQWANEGAWLKFSFRYIQGKEQSLSGTTTEDSYDIRKSHRWVNISLEGQQYFNFTNFFRMGFYGKSVFNSQSLFSNYTASILTMTEFSPLPDSRTLFMTEYRAPQFAGAGLDLVFSYNDLFDFRIEPYFFQPFRQIVQFDNGSFGYSDLLEKGTFMAGASLIFHSPIGPLRISTNYFPKQDKPFTTQISFGYVLFNDRAIR